MTSTAPAAHSHLMECHDCGTIQRLPAMRPGAEATCVTCDAHLRHTRADPISLPLALNIAALILFGIGSGWTLMSVSTAGLSRGATLFTGPGALRTFGLWEVGVVVLITTVLAPLLRILSMIYVLAGLRMTPQPLGSRQVFAWIEHLRPWSMIEIFLLGLFVAFVRLRDIAHVDLGPALIGLSGLTIALFGADTLLDRHAVWEALDQRGPGPSPASHTPVPPGIELRLIGCDTCGLVARGYPGALCPRCGFMLHHRKASSFARAWALLLAAAVMYIPANAYPFLTVIQLGAGHPSTILGGVRELLEAKMWPLAALVFFASVAVPLLKLAGMIVLLTTTASGVRTRRRDRTLLYRIVDAVGRWSMIDVFMMSILAALVQFGAVVTIIPGPGAIAFAAVVILTMLAAMAFDPRLIWDHAANPRPIRHHE